MAILCHCIIKRLANQARVVFTPEIPGNYIICLFFTGENFTLKSLIIIYLALGRIDLYSL